MGDTKSGYEVYSTFRGARISAHRTLTTAVKAMRAYGRVFTGGSYDPTIIRHADGSELTDAQHEESMRIGHDLGYW